MPARTKKRAMTDEHKTALAEGRNHAKTVGRYLEALEANKPKRGRKRTADSVKKRLGTVETELKAASGIQRLTLLQERRDLEVELAGMQSGNARSLRPRKGVREGREAVRRSAKGSPTARGASSVCRRKC